MDAVVGRDRELEQLETFLGSREGPRILVIEGEPGIGKTTLWRAAVAQARAGAARVLSTQAAASERELPFVGLTDLLAAVVPDVSSELPPPQRRALAAALLLEDSAGAAQPRTVAAAVLSSLRELAATTPVLVAADDVQWLDEPSRAALAFALRRVESDEPITCVLGWRVESEEDAFPLGRELLAAEHTQRMQLGPLSLGALHRLLTARLTRPLPRPALTRVHSASGGNPFFALELARLVERRGWPRDGSPLPLPTDVSDMLRERLEAVSDETFEALLAVALMGSATSVLLDRALGIDAQELLEPALTTGLIERDADDRVRFTHPLYATAVETRAWPEQRRACHRRLADVAEDPDERALHLAQAVEGEDPLLALALEDAAERARRRGAPDVAASLAEQAWRATDSGDRAERWRRGVLAAEQHVQSGDAERFRELADDLLAEAQTGDERSNALALQSLAPRDGETPLSLLDRALEQASGARQRQSVESDYVAEAVLTGDVELGAAHAEASLSLAEELDDRVVLAGALTTLARVEQLRGAGLRGELLERADGILAAADTGTLERTVDLVRSTVTTAGILATADRFEDGRRRLDEVERLLSARGLFVHLPEVLRARAELECWAGCWREAERIARTGGELADQTGRVDSHQDLLPALLFVAAHEGRHDDAQALYDEAYADGEPSPRAAMRILAPMGALALSKGDADGALAHLERAEALATRAGYVEPNWLRYHGDLAIALVGAERQAEADAVVSGLDERARITRYPWSQLAASKGRAAAMAARDDLECSVQELARAEILARALGNRYELARVQLQRGAVERRARRRTLSRRYLGEAADGFAELGATLWEQAAREEAQRVSGRRTTAAGELTEAERRIAALVAEGESNKEVAARLFLSVKTVEVTLTRVYRKLGVKNRAELAARYAELAKE